MSDNTERFMPCLVACHVEGPGRWSQYSPRNQVHSGAYLTETFRRGDVVVGRPFSFKLGHNGRVDVLDITSKRDKTRSVIGRGMRGRLIKKGRESGPYVTGIDFIGLATDSAEARVLQLFQLEGSRQLGLDEAMAHPLRIAELVPEVERDVWRIQPVLPTGNIDDTVSAAKRDDLRIPYGMVSVVWTWGATSWKDPIDRADETARWVETQLGPRRYDAEIVTVPPSGLILEDRQALVLVKN